MIPLKINHDSQGSGEQWGRDKIYPELWTIFPFQCFFQKNITDPNGAAIYIYINMVLHGSHQYTPYDC